jgi:hypothetical protein
MARKKRKQDLRLWERFKEKVEAADGARVKIGVLSNGKGREVVEGAPFDMIALAAIHEFGEPARPWSGFAGIPPRPFIRATFEANREQTKKRVQALAVAFLKGKISLNRGLHALGQWGTAEVKRYITVGDNLLPNAPSTIARKGSARPLVEDGQLLNSITYEVEGGGAAGRAGWRK